MSMFCYQCQETKKNTGCDVAGMCGKKEKVANLQDLLVYVLCGLASAAFYEKQQENQEVGRFITRSLFMTITNANFDPLSIQRQVDRGLILRDRLKERFSGWKQAKEEALFWSPSTEEDAEEKGKKVGYLSIEKEDIRSLKTLWLLGLKGISAYTEHAAHLGKEDSKIYSFLTESLHEFRQELSEEVLVEKVMKTGEMAVRAMDLLDKANTEAYGNPEISEVPLGTGILPGILISGHDLKDLEVLLEQTKGTGVDVYTHGEMLPAHYYPAFKKYDHLMGNYGNAWWEQQTEFDLFNGPILMTTNCIVPVKDSYKDRIFTTGAVGYPEIRHIPDEEKGNEKDFHEIIELAKTCPPPTEIESGSIVGGFSHHQALALSDSLVNAVKTGAISRFIVMAGCDGRHKTRAYYAKVAENLPKDAVILTAGCAKYRYNKLDLGDIQGIPRVLDAGQCNDSYSLVLTALKLKEIFGVDSVNDLPISFDIAWYEQKAVAVLLALLHLGVKNIRLGPTYPAFLSPRVADLLIHKFNLKPITDPLEDIDLMMQGK